MSSIINGSSTSRNGSDFSNQQQTEQEALYLVPLFTGALKDADVKSLFEPQAADLRKMAIKHIRAKYPENVHPSWVQQASSTTGQISSRPKQSLEIQQLFSKPEILLQLLNSAEQPKWFSELFGSKQRLLALRDANARSLLHVACRWKHPNSLELITRLMTNWPELAQTRDRLGKLPFDSLDRDAIQAVIHSRILVAPVMPSQQRYEMLSLLCQLDDDSLAMDYIKAVPYSLLPIDLNQRPKIAEGRFTDAHGELPLAVCARLGKMELFHQLLKANGTTLDNYATIVFSKLRWVDFNRPEILDYAKQPNPSGHTSPLLLSHPLIAPAAKHFSPDTATDSLRVIGERLEGSCRISEYQATGTVNCSDLKACLRALAYCEDLPMAHELGRHLMTSSASASAILDDLIEDFSIDERRVSELLVSLAAECIKSRQGMPDKELAVLAVLLWTLPKEALSARLGNLSATRAINALGTYLEYAPQSKTGLLARLKLLTELGAFKKVDRFGSEGHPLLFFGNDMHPIFPDFLEWALENFDFVRQGVSVPLFVSSDQDPDIPQWVLLRGFLYISPDSDWKLVKSNSAQPKHAFRITELLLPHSLSILGRKASRELPNTVPTTGEFLLLLASPAIIEMVKKAGFQPRPEVLRRLMHEAIQEAFDHQPSEVVALVKAYASFHPDGDKAVEALDWGKLVRENYRRVSLWSTLADLAKNYPAVKQELDLTDPVASLTPEVESDAFRSAITLAVSCGFNIERTHVAAFFAGRPRQDIFWLIKEGHAPLPVSAARSTGMTSDFTNSLRSIHTAAERELSVFYCLTKQQQSWVLEQSGDTRILATSSQNPAHCYELVITNGKYLVGLEKGYYSAKGLVAEGKRLMTIAERHLEIARIRQALPEYFSYNHPLTPAGFDSLNLAKFPIRFQTTMDGKIHGYQLMTQGGQWVVAGFNIDGPTSELYKKVEQAIKECEEDTKKQLEAVTQICKELGIKVNKVVWGSRTQAEIKWGKTYSPDPEVRLCPSSGRILFKFMPDEKLSKILAREFQGLTFGLTQSLPLDAPSSKASMRRLLTGLKHQQAVMQLFAKDRDKGSLVMPGEVLGRHAHEIFDKIHQRQIESSAEWTIAPLVDRMIIFLKGLTVLGGQAIDAKQALEQLRVISEYSQGKLNLHVKTLNASVVDLVQYSCPGKAVDIKLLDTVKKDAARLFSGKTTSGSAVRTVVSQICQGDGFSGLQKERDADKYREMYIQLTHIYKTLQDQKDDSELKTLLLNLGHYKSDCGWGISQFINEEYLRVVQKMDPSSASSSESQEILPKLVSGAIQELLDSLISFAQNPVARTQTRHLRNYLRRELVKIGYKLPRDPMVGDTGQDSSRDIYLGGDYVADYPHEALKRIFRSLLIPAIVRRVLEEQETLINSGDFEGFNKLQKAFTEALEEWNELRDTALVKKLQASRTQQKDALQLSRIELDQSRNQQEQLACSSSSWSAVTSLRSQRDRLEAKINKQRAAEMQIKASLAQMTDDNPKKRKRSDSENTDNANIQLEALSTSLSHREEKRQKLRKEQKAVEKLLEQLEEASLFKDLVQAEKELKEKTDKSQTAGVRFAAERKDLIINYALEAENGYMEESDALGGIEILTAKGVCLMLEAKGIFYRQSLVLTPSSAFRQVSRVTRPNQQQTQPQNHQDELEVLAMVQNFFPEA